MTQMVNDVLLLGLSVFGSVALFGLGIGAAIDLFKSFGGVR